MLNKFDFLTEVINWVKHIKGVSLFKKDYVDLIYMKDWFYNSKNHSIMHRNNSFFEIVNLKRTIKSKNLSVQSVSNQIVIHQFGIGILGLVTRKNYQNTYVLLQCKFEPGNINGIQLSPSIQATESNLDRSHKGKSPLLSNLFNEPKNNPKVKHLSLQTEMNEILYKKVNQNIILELSENDELNLDNENFAWVNIELIKNLYKIPNLINMSLRSLIPALHYKYLYKYKKDSISKITSEYFTRNLKLITKMRNSISLTYDSETLDLSKLYTSNYRIKFIKVFSNTREKLEWDQPIISSSNRIKYQLVIFNEKDPQFLVRLKLPFAPYNNYELTTTMDSNYSKYKLNEMLNSSPKRIFNNIFSDEGGRFDMIQSEYEILEIKSLDDIKYDTNEFMWVNLKNLYELNNLGGYIDVQLRTLLGYF